MAHGVLLLPGVINLYDRMERMALLRPAFVTVTWGTNCSTKDLSLDIGTGVASAACCYSAVVVYDLSYSPVPSQHHSGFVDKEIIVTQTVICPIFSHLCLCMCAPPAAAQNLMGLETLLHLTCTNTPTETLLEILNSARANGIQNIFALRGGVSAQLDEDCGLESLFPSMGTRDLATLACGMCRLNLLTFSCTLCFMHNTAQTWGDSTGPRTQTPPPPPHRDFLFSPTGGAGLPLWTPSPPPPSAQVQLKTGFWDLFF